MTVATGGHPPIYHLSAPTGQAIRPQASRPKGGMLIGALAEPRFAATTFRLAPGEALLLYTDGLTEARTETGDMLGEQGLTAFLTERSGPAGATAIVEDTVALIDTLPRDAGDDVALLALSVPAADTDVDGAAVTAHTIAPAGPTPEKHP